MSHSTVEKCDRLSILIEQIKDLLSLVEVFDTMDHDKVEYDKAESSDHVELVLNYVNLAIQELELLDYTGSKEDICVSDVSAGCTEVKMGVEPLVKRQRKSLKSKSYTRTTTDLKSQHSDNISTDLTITVQLPQVPSSTASCASEGNNSDNISISTSNPLDNSHPVQLSNIQSFMTPPGDHNLYSSDAYDVTSAHKSVFVNQTVDPIHSSSPTLGATHCLPSLGTTEHCPTVGSSMVRASPLVDPVLYDQNYTTLNDSIAGEGNQMEYYNHPPTHQQYWNI